MARHETRPDEPPPWPLLRELGPELFQVAVRAQVAWYGPTAAWAIALDLGVPTLKVADALRGMWRAGEVSAVEDTSSRDRRWVLADSSALPLDLWTFTIAWLARRSFSTAVADLIGRASEGATVPGDVRGDLAVLGDMLELEGLWIAALLSGSLIVRQEHEAALAEAVRAARSEEHAAGGLSGPGLADAAAAMGCSLSDLNRAMAQVSAAFEPMAEAIRRTTTTMGEAALVELAATLEQDEAPQRRRGPVGDRLRRRLDRGRRNRTVGSKR